jgi:acylglycerol lipase
MAPEIGAAHASDGTVLRTLEWRPANAAWAGLLLVHGLGEHAGRYDHVANQMTDAGIEVHAYDHRGFGGSGGQRAYVDRWTDLHDDLGLRLAATRIAVPDVPLVLYGHSMGGLIALGYVLSGTPRPQPDLLVLTSPALDSTIAAWKEGLAPLLSRIAPRLRVPNGFRPGDLSRDPAVDERVANDPLCQSTSTARIGAEGFAEQRRLRGAVGGGWRLPIPTYVAHGGDDPIVPVGASAALELDPNVTRRVYPGLHHETHNEPEGPAVVSDTIAWIRANALSSR